MDTRTYMWRNYRTGKIDILSEQPADFSDYLPQEKVFQDLYRLQLKLGKTPIDAIQHVLELMVKLTPKREGDL